MSVIVLFVREKIAIMNKIATRVCISFAQSINFRFCLLTTR